LLFELLIAVLQLLDLAGEIADRLLETTDAGHQIGWRILPRIPPRILRGGGTGPLHAGKRNRKQDGGTEHLAR
jgi:hypothetical protein